MYKVLKRIGLALGLSALLLGIVGIGSAQAAADITKGGLCSVSANWDINVSANFNNTSGNPSTGLLDYVVMTSPGELNDNEFPHSVWRAYNAAGSLVTASYLASGDTWHDKGVIDGKHTYRSDPNASSIRRVEIDPASYTGVYCHDYSSYTTLYSSN